MGHITESQRSLNQTVACINTVRTLGFLLYWRAWEFRPTYANFGCLSAQCQTLVSPLLSVSRDFGFSTSLSPEQPPTIFLGPSALQALWISLFLNERYAWSFSATLPCALSLNP